MPSLPLCLFLGPLFLPPWVLLLSARVHLDLGALLNTEKSTPAQCLPPVLLKLSGRPQAAF